MKKFFTPFMMSILLGLTHNVCLAQQGKEAEIRKLENMEGEAFVKKDTITLFKLFSPDLLVNSPSNRVATLQDIKTLIRSGKIDLSSVEKIIEKIGFIRNIAIVMGHDIVKPQGEMQNAGKTVTRRYTDIWMKDETGWRLTARQATNISVL